MGVNYNDLRKRLGECPAGSDGWSKFEQVGLEVLEAVLVPPLEPAMVQSRTLEGVERRDAVFPNRVRDSSSTWGILHADYKARLIPVEFKNYDKSGIGKDEVNQAGIYLRSPWGKLAMLCRNKEPKKSAYRQRNTIYNHSGKVILFVTLADLLEMLDILERGENPSDFVLDKVEEFLLQHD
ncbi:hypothetical protein [Nocardioides sp. CFH 31398]|uniref:hypothetical protein n=1 Tax=Nocardioides sp. CFH 31398 TaxID=2919579 RepID=UPI001F050C65|nr:hypothetical protein [Nocardioides sp. CFH 31398]MCH1868785.1 hypothetical protein [Nocardioides sp. CFH 31398]